MDPFSVQICDSEGVYARSTLCDCRCGPPWRMLRVRDREQRACARLRACSHAGALRLCPGCTIRRHRRTLVCRHPAADRAPGRVDPEGHHRQNRKVVTWPQPARHEERQVALGLGGRVVAAAHEQLLDPHVGRLDLCLRENEILVGVVVVEVVSGKDAWKGNVDWTKVIAELERGLGQR